MLRQDLIEALQQYQTSYREELEFIPAFITLLEHPRAYQRDHFPGHITGSAWILDLTRMTVLLTHHAKLDRWLQPGGHADGNEHIIEVALKEAAEETGLTKLSLWKDAVFDIDIHTIPARGSFPEHQHYDIRVLLLATSDEPFSVSNESKELAWVPLEKLDDQTGNNRSILRMAEKTTRLFSANQ